MSDASKLKLVKDQQESESSEKKQDLIDSSLQLEKSLQIFQDINDKAHFIALNAAIEGARMSGKLSTFSIVAGEIAAQALKNYDLSEKLERSIHHIKELAVESHSVRNMELADDLIDKLDRNLFERNCDVQAWASFDVILNAAQMSNPNPSPNPDGGEVDKIQIDVAAGEACRTLEKLVSIYVVYLDSFLLNKEGKVIAAARRRDWMGDDWKQERWFKSAAEGKVHVTEVQYSKLVSSHSLFYVAPVLDADNQVVGVLCNCFDWRYALEMIDSAGYDDNTRGTVIDAWGRVIASNRHHQILNDSLEWLRAGENAVDKLGGYTSEKSRNGESLAVGFAHTKGYNSYRGKNWSAVVLEKVGEIDIPTQSTVCMNRQNPADLNAARSKVIESEKVGRKLRDMMHEIDAEVDEVNANNRAVKLLAVNASIQSGLAGADGEGFSIIANEVANLAKKSLKFVEEVNLTTTSLRKAVEDSVSTRLVDAAKDAMSKIDRNLFERYCDIQAWSTFSKFADLLRGKGDINDCNELLEKIHKIYEVYHDIYILDTSGRTVATAINKSIVGHNFNGKDWFREGVSGSICVTDVYMSETLKCPLMTFSAPIYDAEHKIIGVICSRFNCSFINQIINATTVDSSSSTYLLNSKGQVIGSCDGIGVFERGFGDISLFQSMDHGKFGITHEKDANEKRDYLVGFSYSRGYNTYKEQKWTVITRRPAPEANAEAELTPHERYKRLFAKGA